MAIPFEFDTAEAGGFGLVRSNLSHLRLVPGTLGMSDSYPEGGEDMDLDRFFKRCLGAVIMPKNGYVLEYDPDTKKVKAFTAPGVEVVVATDLSALANVGFIAVGI